MLEIGQAAKLRGKCADIAVFKTSMISVCMATYNGETYLQDQLDSIITNLSTGDEIVISDDGSTDGTLEILERYCDRYDFIRVFDGPHEGVIRNFDNAIQKSIGDYIFLADQDDIWSTEKVAKMMPYFDDPECLVVVHDAELIDAQGKSLEKNLYSLRGSKAGFFKNLGKNSYVGCCMAFRASMKPVVLPIPRNIEMHDWWIGLISEAKHGSRFIPEKLLLYRRHDGNVSGLHHYKLAKMIRNRAVLLLEFLIRSMASGIQ